jgi:type I protein arginine methyltransferase
MRACQNYQDYDSDSFTSDNSNKEEELEELEELEEIKCLFCAVTLENIESTFAHLKSVHQFDLTEIRRAHSLNFYDSVKLINYIRHRHCTPETPGKEDSVLNGDIDSIVAEIRDATDSDQFLVPVIQDDPLLQTFDYFDSTNDVDEDDYYTPDQSTPYPIVSTLEDSVGTVRIQEIIQTLSDKSPEDGSPRGYPEAEKEIEGEGGDYYFDSYSNVDIHEQMLKDRVRTEAYRDFIYDNKHFFKDRIVLDVGCGTGILSFFAARAGAKKVYAVDNSEMIHVAEAIARRNGLDRSVLTFLKGKIEEVQLPEKVDVIVSEWMGYFLLFESMLDSVLYAREKWLRVGGVCLPSEAKIWVGAVENDDWFNDRVAFWSDVYGFDMREAVMPLIRRDVLIDHVPANRFLCQPVCIRHIDCNQVTVKELEFESEVELEVVADRCTIHHLSIWFDVSFSIPDNSDLGNGMRVNQVTMSTSPAGRETHWKQSLLLLDEPIEAEQGQKLRFRLQVKKNPKNPRSIICNLVNLTRNNKLQTFILQ